MKIILDNNNYLSVRNTPWDTKAFGYKTNEVLKFYYDDEESLRILLSLFDKYNLNNTITLTTCRIDADDRLLKKVLQDFSFSYIETSFELERNNILKQNWCQYGRFFPLDVITDIEEINQIKEIVSNDFEYSKYHSDVRINHVLASRRYINWIDDLYKGQKEFFIYKSKKGKVICFHIHEIDGKIARLILTGCARGKSMIAISFWSSILNHLKESDIGQATTLISAANLGAVNLHSHLDFTFKKALFGYNKIYRYN